MPLDASNAWDKLNQLSNPIEDIRIATDAIFNERWICKECGETIYHYPERQEWIDSKLYTYVLDCPNCKARKWHHTSKPIIE